MIEMLRKLKAILMADPILASKITDVYRRPVRKDAVMPYLVHEGEEFDGGHTIMRELLYSVDIYDRSKSLDLASQIADRVQKVLDRQTISVPGRSAARVFYDTGPHVVPEPEGAVQHLHLEFMVRYALDGLAAQE